MSEKIFLGSFEGGVDTVVIPNQVLERANAQLDAARTRREKIAAEAKAAALRSARTHGRLRKLVRALFRGHRRIPQ